MNYLDVTNVKIDLGAGADKRPGYLGVDQLDLPGVDIVCNLSEGIPLQDNSVEAVSSSHFLEHIADTVGLMEEIYRVCKPNALVEIKVPYFTSIGAFKDPTHVSFFTERTWEYFDVSYTDSKRLPSYLLKCNFKLEHVAYIWHRRWYRFLPFKRTLLLPHFWNIAKTMYVRLRVIKNVDE